MIIMIIIRDMITFPPQWFFLKTGQGRDYEFCIGFSQLRPFRAIRLIKSESRVRKLHVESILNKNIEN